MLERADRWPLAALLAVSAFILILTFPRWAYIGDPYWMRAQAQAWLEGRGDVPAQYADDLEVGQYCYRNPQTGLYYSKYGLANSLCMAPVVWLWNREGISAYQSQVGNKAVAILNFYNLLWALAIAGLTYLGGRLWGYNPWLVALWSFLCLFSGFGWNYLRAQNGEIFQWAGALLFFYGAARLWLQSAAPSSERWAWLSLWLGLALLVFLKASYWLLLPCWLMLYLWPQEREKRGAQILENLRRPALWGPLLAILALFLATNYWRFGGVFNTGYTQWSREAQAFSGSLWEGVTGYLWSADKGLFWHWPLLALALWGWPQFIKKFPRPALLVASCALVMLLLNSKFVNWGGHWCYGPRYMLFILVPASWPALELGAYLYRERARWRERLATLGIGALLAYSTYLQIQVNGLEFFTYYRVERLTTLYVTPQANREYARRHFGVIYGELANFQRRGVYPPWLLTASRESPQAAAQLPLLLRQIVVSNYYWF